MDIQLGATNTFDRGVYKFVNNFLLKICAILVFGVLLYPAMIFASSEKVEEVPRGSTLRAQLFDIARPAAEKIAGQPLKFAGRMVRLGDWVYFSGVVVDDKGRPILVRNLASDTLLLWRRMDGRWELLDAGVGATDAYHYDEWPEKFGAPMQLLRGR
jgi:hypothetical protein